MTRKVFGPNCQNHTANCRDKHTNGGENLCNIGPRHKLNGT